jgi:hypothetical protein
MSSSIFTIKATEIAGTLLANGAPADLMTTPGPFIAFIEQLLTNLLPMLSACVPIGKPEDLLLKLNNPSVAEKWYLLRTIRTQMDDPVMFHSMGKPIYLSMLASGKKASIADATAMMVQSA